MTKYDNDHRCFLFLSAKQLWVVRGQALRLCVAQARLQWEQLTSGA